MAVGTPGSNFKGTVACVVAIGEEGFYCTKGGSVVFGIAVAVITGTAVTG